MESHCSISANASHDGHIETKGNYLVKYRDGKVSIWETKGESKIEEFDEDNENLGYAKAEEFVENLFKTDRSVRLHITQKRIDHY
jgi:hypothetical protein